MTILCPSVPNIYGHTAWYKYRDGVCMHKILESNLVCIIFNTNFTTGAIKTMRFMKPVQYSTEFYIVYHRCTCNRCSFSFFYLFFFIEQVRTSSKEFCWVRALIPPSIIVPIFKPLFLDFEKFFVPKTVERWRIYCTARFGLEKVRLTLLCIFLIMSLMVNWSGQVTKVCVISCLLSM